MSECSNWYEGDPILEAYHKNEWCKISPMMQTIAELREKYDLHMKVERFVSIGDNAEDNQFIRR